MSWWQMFLAWLANLAGQRQGVAQEAARQEQVRTQAENQALRQHTDIQQSVQAMDDDAVQQELRDKWSRP